jgi:hypothetical protein
LLLPSSSLSFLQYPVLITTFYILSFAVLYFLFMSKYLKIHVMRLSIKRCCLSYFSINPLELTRQLSASSLFKVTFHAPLNIIVLCLPAFFFILNFFFFVCTIFISFLLSNFSLSEVAYSDACSVTVLCIITCHV